MVPYMGLLNFVSVSLSDGPTTATAPVGISGESTVMAFSAKQWSPPGLLKSPVLHTKLKTTGSFQLFTRYSKSGFLKSGFAQPVAPPQPLYPIIPTP